MDPLHLAEEEVDYELELRGAPIIGTTRVRANDLKERIENAKRAGAQPRLDMSPYTPADDLVASAVTYEEVRALLREPNLTLVGYRKLRSRTIHLAQRLDRIKPTTAVQVTATKELRSATHVLLEELRTILDGGGSNADDFDSDREFETDHQGAKPNLTDVSLLNETERSGLKYKIETPAHTEQNKAVLCEPQIIITNPLDGTQKLQAIREGSRIWNGEKWLIVGAEQPIRNALGDEGAIGTPLAKQRSGDMLSRIKSLSLSAPDINTVNQDVDTSMRSTQSSATKFSDGRILGSTRKGEEYLLPLFGLTGRKVEFCENNGEPINLSKARTVQGHQQNRNSWHVHHTHHEGRMAYAPPAQQQQQQRVPGLETYTINDRNQISSLTHANLTGLHETVPSTVTTNRNGFLVYQDENLNRPPLQPIRAYGEGLNGPREGQYQVQALPPPNYNNYASNRSYHTPEQFSHGRSHLEHMPAPTFRYGESRTRKPVPINQWKITFSGSSSKDSLPVHDFLTQVEILSHSEGYSDSDLLSQIVHLLTGRARSWYQQAYFTIRTWDAFKTALREKFLPPYYQFVLMAEIEARMQTRDEDVSSYIQDMERKFDRLPEQISESNKVFIVKKNLLPDTAVAIASFDVHTIRALEDICRRFESTKKIVSSNKNRQSHSQPTGRFSRFADRRDQSRRVTEVQGQGENTDSSGSTCHDSDSSEEIYVLRRKRNYTKDKNDRRRSKFVSDKASKPNINDQMECHNCKQLGHGHRDCKEPQTRIFCYNCGQDGVRADECPCKKGNRQASSKGDQVNSLDTIDPSCEQ